MKNRVWLKGDMHLHTTFSDGKLTLDGLIKGAKKRGLDFIIVTDHNKNAVGEKSYYDGNLLVIPGTEYTGSLGHVNIWGSHCPPLDGERPTEECQYLDFEKQAHENGCTVSVNHPFDKKFNWQIDIDNFNMDCVEVWNAPMHYDNMTNLDWWHKSLICGRRLPLVGGSDYHRDYYFTRLIANPTTFVCAEENTEEAVIKALRGGNSFVTNSPGATRLVLSCGDKIMGDEVEMNGPVEIELTADKLRRKMRVQVFNNDEMIYEYTAKKKEKHTAKISVPEKGFVRAQVLYDYGRIGKKIYKTVIKRFSAADAKLPVPSYAFALSNPIYIV